MEKIKAIYNAQLVLETGIVWDGVLLVEGERIAAFGPRRDVEIPVGAEKIDAHGAYVGPGFVDIHVHGGGGYETYEKPREAAEFFLRHGATSILASPLYSLPFAEFMEGIRTIREAMPKAKSIRGMYMEGPYTNPKYGANYDTNPWRHGILPEEYKALCDAAGRDALVWTVAPEREGLMPFLEYARQVNPEVRFALGHSEATPDEVRALGEYIPTILTHAMDATGRKPLYGGTRGVGPDEYCMTAPDMYAELISDSCAIHVHPDLQRLLLHTKGVGRMILITDSTNYPFAPPENLAHVKDLNFDHLGGIAGSKLTMDMACRNVMAATACGIAETFLMASTNPAEAVGLGKELGSISVGKKAALVFTDDKFNVQNVMLDGEMCTF